MADEFDGCECVWSHEFAMQRLLNFIRQSQNHCTDTECIDVSGRVQQQSTTLPSTNDNDDSNFAIMTMLMVLAMIMYFIRPDSIMKLTNTKRSIGGQGPHDGSSPPPPPPAPPAVN